MGIAPCQVQLKFGQGQMRQYSPRLHCPMSSPDICVLWDKSKKQGELTTYINNFAIYELEVILWQNTMTFLEIIKIYTDNFILYWLHMAK